jgi:hypothetical protein
VCFGCGHNQVVSLFSGVVFEYQLDAKWSFVLFHQLFFFFFFFCTARWLMTPDVPQPVRLIVLTLL